MDLSLQVCVLLAIAAAPVSTEPWDLFNLLARRTISGVSSTEMTLIVEQHNDIRKAVVPTASNMRKLYWSSALADVAQDWADECLWGNDGALTRRTEADIGVYVGQNSYHDDDGSHTWSQVVDQWHDERLGGITNVNHLPIGSPVANYSQVVWAKSTLVGCGFKECSSGNVYVCNYGNGHTMRGSPYVVGEACASCSGNCVDGSLCDCSGGIYCRNGGVMNLESCTCTCNNGFTGTLCVTCPTFDQSFKCGHHYTAASCSTDLRVPSVCPVLCGVCPDECGNPLKNVNYCKHGGTLGQDCVCSCTNGYSGEDCSTMDTCVDHDFCGIVPVTLCSSQMRIRTACPVKCGQCS